MNCETYIQLMSAALDGECTAAERAMLDEHLAVCPQCAELFRTLSANAAAARQLDCEVPADLKSRIMSSLPRQDAPAKTDKVIRWKRWIPVAAAACLILVVSLTLPGNFDVGAAPEAASDNRTMDYAEDYDISNASPDYGYATGADGTPAGSTGEASDPGHYTCSNDQVIRVGYGMTPEAPSALIIGSAQELADYLAQFGSWVYEPGSEDPVPSTVLEELAARYTEEYFTAGRLLCVVIEAPSGGDRYELDTQSLLRDSVTVVRTQTGMTCDMAAWLLVAEVDAMFDGGDSLDVTITG